MRTLSFVLAGAAGLVAASSMSQAAVVTNAAPATSSVVLAATWVSGTTYQGPGTWVRDFYAGNGDGQTGLGADAIEIGNWDGTFRAPVFRFLITAGTLGVGESFSTASFSEFIIGKTNAPAFNLDLDAIKSEYHGIHRRVGLRGGRHADRGQFLRGSHRILI